MSNKVRVAVSGVLASGLLLLLYFTVVSFAESSTHAVEEVLSLWYLMVPLVAGFGLQVSLFTYSRHYVQMRREGSASVGATGTMSTVSMIACCAHHLTDALPLLGLTTAAVFLTAYQTLFIGIGVLSNIIGITVVLAIMQKHHLYDPEGPLASLMRVDLKRVRNLTLAGSAVIALTLGGVTYANPGPTPQAEPSSILTLPTRTNEANGLTIAVTPLPFSFGKEISFKVSFDTHSGDLGFDMSEVAYLEDGNGGLYQPRGWSGAPPGGHHREGTLSFPAIPDGSPSMRLVLRGLYGAESRIFDWNLQTVTGPLD